MYLSNFVKPEQTHDLYANTANLWMTHSTIEMWMYSANSKAGNRAEHQQQNQQDGKITLTIIGLEGQMQV